MAGIEITAVELRRNLSEMLSRVAYQDQEVAITRNGKPVAALISPRTLERLHAAADPTSSPPRPRYQLSERARSSLEALPAEVSARLLARIEALVADPRPPGSRKLQSGEWRIALERYRIVYNVHDEAIHVEHIGTRENVYRELGIRS